MMDETYTSTVRQRRSAQKVAQHEESENLDSESPSRGNGVANGSRYNDDKKRESIMQAGFRNAKRVLKLESICKRLHAYVKYIEKSSNQDKILKTIQYTLWMISRFYCRDAKSLASKLLLSVSADISSARCITRLVEFPTALDGLWLGDWASDKLLGRLMAVSMIFYYPLEHLAYVQWKAPGTRIIPSSIVSGGKEKLADRASAWSCRFWLLYIALDTARAMLALQESPKGDQKPNKTANKIEKTQLLRNFLFSLPAMHWSRHDDVPLISDTVRNTLMWLESLTALYQSLQS